MLFALSADVKLKYLKNLMIFIKKLNCLKLTVANLMTGTKFKLVLIESERCKISSEWCPVVAVPKFQTIG